MAYDGTSIKDLNANLPAESTGKIPELNDSDREIKTVMRNQYSITTLTGTPTTLDATHHIVVLNMASAITVNLPTASTVASSGFKKEYIIKNIGAGTGTVGGTVILNGTSTSSPTLAQHDELHIWTEGTNWYGVKISTTVQDNALIMGSSNPIGSILQYGGLVVPSGYLFCDGTAISRSTYSRLLGVITKSTTVTISIASPAVISWTDHGLVAGDVVSFETTGALPTGLSVGTSYYVISAGLTSSQFEISTTFGGAAVNTSGTQSGTHTGRNNPFGCGDGSTTFNVPDFRRRVSVGKGGSASSALGAALGDSGGEETHLLTAGESGVPGHVHQEMATDDNGVNPIGVYNIGSGSSNNYTIIRDSLFTANASPPGPLNTASNTTASAASAHNIMQPSLVVNYIIKY